MTLNDAFGIVADTGTWEDASAVLAGFLAPTVARNVIEPNTGQDLPDEVYGILVVLGGQYSPMYGNMVTLGGATYTVDKLLQRVNLKQSITQMGEGN
ncbi:hypothetical protein ACM16X_04970 [Haloarcula japonica]|uniref:hypothetical protein n=1 Tax=Haloarcula japonica TaxID=29282 RepID=UPI0039F6C1A6